MKHIILFGLFAGVISIAVAEDIILGTINPEDKIVYSQKIAVQKAEGRVQESLVTYNPWFIKPIITAVKVENIRKDKNLDEEPTMEVINGGIGETSIKLRVKTKKSKGMRVEVKIYGKYSDTVDKKLTTLQRKFEEKDISTKLNNFEKKLLKSSKKY
ncbi:uncharacterized protein LOC142240349 [Haematobia irritans]|uniref:uncharacterized protein LOC142240349 n=1 Tax=Haematobia irritans TaxID=7368 RepID=UPI003F5008A2